MSSSTIKYAQLVLLMVVVALVAFFNFSYSFYGDTNSSRKIVDAAWEEDACPTRSCPYTGLPLANITSINHFKIAVPTFNDPSTSTQDNAVLIGKQRAKKVYLTIGIPSVQRPKMAQGWRYLLETIQSIIDATSDSQRQELVIVIFLSDFNQRYKDTVIEEITQKYSQYLGNGLIQILQVSQKAYPSLRNLKKNYNDKPDRVYWRSKQNVDFSLLMAFSQNLSTYYIQLEDDVGCANNFIGAIRQFIGNQRKAWISLEFSSLGFIGKLFKNEDLGKLSKFFMLFYEEQPCDYLIRHFKSAMVQFKDIMRKPALFQHRGVISSLRGTRNKLKDKFFAENAASHNANPPTLVLNTTMNHYKHYSLDALYSGNEFFWGKNVDKGGYIRVVWEVAQNISALTLTTGREDKGRVTKDILRHGSVGLSDKEDCSDMQEIATLDDTHINVVLKNMRSIFKDSYKCFELTVKKTQDDWFVIKEFAVFTLR